MSINTHAKSVPIKMTTSPILTGGCVLGIIYSGGILLAADTLASYGSMSMHKDVQKLHTFSNGAMIAVSGEFSDYQEIIQELEAMIDQSRYEDTNSVITPYETSNYIRALLYSKRNEFKPYWNDILVAGYDDGKPHLHFIDQLGLTYQDPYIATGMGVSFALPLLRKEWRDNLTEEEARAILEQAMRLCYYGDCKMNNRWQIGKITPEQCTISEPFSLETSWV